MLKRKLTREERFGAQVTLGAHFLLIIMLFIMMTRPDEEQRTAFIEVTLGEFRDGAPAQFATQRVPEVATAPEQVLVPETEPQPIPRPVEQVQRQQEEPVKDVELPEQQEVVPDDEVIQTPETDVVNPETVIQEERQEQQEETPQPVQQVDSQTRSGAEVSGTVDGRTGRMDADQGTSRDDERSAPYLLEWDGDLDRTPMIQQLPDYPVEVEAVITVRFEVRPDGTVGRIIPVRRMNPELEREVERALRQWRFTRLPSGVPQTVQQGTITFRFVLD